MPRATKSTVQDLCRRKGYELGAARRGLGCTWKVELFRQYEGREVLERTADDSQLAEAYGELAVWLRDRPDVVRSLDDRVQR